MINIKFVSLKSDFIFLNLCKYTKSDSHLLIFKITLDYLLLLLLQSAVNIIHLMMDLTPTDGTICCQQQLTFCSCQLFCPSPRCGHVPQQFEASPGGHSVVSVKEQKHIPNHASLMFSVAFSFVCII